MSWWVVDGLIEFQLMPRLRMRLCGKILAHIWNFRFALGDAGGSVGLGKNIVASAVTAINIF